jgi:hypothetical protein
MAQIRGTAGYNLGHQNPFGGPSSADATSDPSPLDAIREQTSKIEDWLDTLADPVKPYVHHSLRDLAPWKLYATRELQTNPKQGISRHALTPCSLVPGTCPRSVAS